MAPTSKETSMTPCIPVVSMVPARAGLTPHRTGKLAWPFRTPPSHLTLPTTPSPADQPLGLAHTLSPTHWPRPHPFSPAHSLQLPLCFQRLAALQQVVAAQKISFLLRAGLRILVALRDTDAGEGVAACLQAWCIGVVPSYPIPVHTGQ